MLYVMEILFLQFSSPAYCVTWFHNTNMHDSDHECQVIRSISFVAPWFPQHLRCSSEYHNFVQALISQ